MSEDLLKSSKPDSRFERPQVTWGPVAAVGVIFFIFFIAPLFARAIVSIYPSLKGWTLGQAQDWFKNSTAAKASFVFAVEGTSLMLLYGFLRLRKANLSMIGLVRPKLRDVGYALIGYGAYLPMLYLLAVQLIPNLFPGVDVEQKQQIGFEQTGIQSDLILIFISLVILVPITEEILIRGFLYGGLKTKLPRFLAILTASILFGIVHLQLGSGAPPLWLAAVDTFILSVVLIGLRELTGSLWASIFLHMAKNCIAFSYIFIFHLS